jgi:hypothetical protein
LVHFGLAAVVDFLKHLQELFIAGAGHQRPGLQENRAHELLGVEAFEAGYAVVHGSHKARVVRLLEGGDFGGDALDKLRYLLGLIGFPSFPLASAKFLGAALVSGRQHHLGVGKA